MNEDSQESGGRLELVVAILIAIATVLAAVLAWRASVVADASGDADFDGIRASTFAAETRSLNYVNAYEHYGAFTTYSRYNELGTMLEEDLAKSGEAATEDQKLLIDRQKAEAFDLAKANQELFPSRYMNRDGSYGVQREMGERWADASKERDLNPDPLYAEADKLRQKADQILGMLTFIGVGLVFFTLVESVESRTLRYLFAVLGTLLAFGGSIAGFYIDLFVK